MDTAGRSSLLQEFTTQQNENAFLRAFSFSTTQLPVSSAEDVALADRVIMMGQIGFIFQLMEREQKVASKDDLKSKLDRLVAAAKSAGGPDNITAVLIAARNVNGNLKP